MTAYMAVYMAAYMTACMTVCVGCLYGKFLMDYISQRTKEWILHLERILLAKRMGKPER